MACEYNNIVNNIENMLSKLSANQKERDDVKPLIKWLNEAKVIGKSNENFDKDLDTKLRDTLTKLYPEIKLEYTEDEIQYIDSNGNVMNQEEDSKIARIKFNREGDTYYTKNQINYRRHRFIDKVDNKKSRTTKNVVNSLLKSLYHSEIRTEKDVKDLNELFKPYPEIYTEDVKNLIEKIQKHTNNKFKKHTLKEWSDIYYKEKDIKKEIDYTRKIIGDKFGFKEFIQSDEVKSYEFGFSAQFVKTSEEEKSTIGQTKQEDSIIYTNEEVDIIQPSEVFTKNINKMMKC